MQSSDLPAEHKARVGVSCLASESVELLPHANIRRQLRKEGIASVRIPDEGKSWVNFLCPICGEEIGVYARSPSIARRSSLKSSFTALVLLPLFGIGFGYLILSGKLTEGEVPLLAKIIVAIVEPLIVVFTVAAFVTYWGVFRGKDAPWPLVVIENNERNSGTTIKEKHFLFRPEGV